MQRGHLSWPSLLSLHICPVLFLQESRPYPFLNTMADTYDNLNRALHGRLPAVAKTVAEVVGHLLMKLTHDHLLPLDYGCYGDVLLQHVTRFNEYTTLLKVGAEIWGQTDTVTSSAGGKEGEGDPVRRGSSRTLLEANKVFGA